MSTCKDCIHYEICDIMADQYGIPKVPSSQCGFYKNTTDVVEVVRCKDCKYYCPYNNGYCTHGTGLMALDENQFCSYGERSENGT